MFNLRGCLIRVVVCRIGTATDAVLVLLRMPYWYCHGCRIGTATDAVLVLPRMPYWYRHGCRISTATDAVSVLPRMPYQYCHGSLLLGIEGCLYCKCVGVKCMVCDYVCRREGVCLDVGCCSFGGCMFVFVCWEMGCW